MLSVEAMTRIPPSSTAVRDRFLADHRELEKLFTRLLAAFEVSDCEGVTTLWVDFADRMTKHLDVEERFMIPGLFAVRPRDARAILAEHRHIRSRLSELDCRVDRRIVRLARAAGFVEELRAHARHEEEVLYRWADDHLAVGERSTLFAALAGPPKEALAT